MKKSILSLFVLVLFAGVFGCAPKQTWNIEQRMDVREALQNYRKMIYLNDLTDTEFDVFADSVTTNLENSYPVYAEFVAMEGMKDTVKEVVVVMIARDLDANARNMRHLFTYNDMAAQNILPVGLNHNQLNQFYTCLAEKVNARYQTMEGFINAVLADTTVTAQIRQFQQECAAALPVTETEKVQQEYAAE